MEMSQEQIFASFTHWKYSENTWFITFMGGSQYIYLLEGDDHALLIDTGYGFGSLRAYVERLTPKPVIVVNSHGHLDHVGSNGEFPEAHMLPGAIKDMETLAGGPCDISKLPYPDYKKIFIADGDVFHLGGRDVEVADISSHAHGSIALIDPSSRLIYCGDEIESGQVLMFNMHQEAYDLREHLLKHKANMQKLKDRAGGFTGLCPAHNGSPIALSYLDDYIALSEQILAGTAQIEEKLNHIHIEKSPLAKGLVRARWQKASFIVRKSDLAGLAVRADR